MEDGGEMLGEELEGSERLVNQGIEDNTKEAAQLCQAHVRLMAEGGTTTLISVSPCLICLSTFVCRD